MPVEWAIYTHETRMVLLGTATGGVSYIKAFQFVSTGLVVLPPFTAGAAASALALMGVPSAAGTAAGIGPAGGVSVTGLGLGLVSDIGGGGLVGVGSAAVAAVGGLAASPAAAAAVATPPVRVPPENLRLIKVYGRWGQWGVCVVGSAVCRTSGVVMAVPLVAESTPSPAVAAAAQMGGGS